MSSRWPRKPPSPDAPYDESWSEPEDGQPWPGPGWQETDQQNYPGQWGQAPDSGEQWATAPTQAWAPGGQDYVDQSYAAHDRWQAGQQPDPAAGRGHAQNAGEFGDEVDYSWFEYLGQGQSARPAPDQAPAPQAFTPDHGQPQPRRGRRERVDPGLAPPDRSGSGFAPPGQGPVPPERGDPGPSRPHRGSRHARRAPAEEDPGPPGPAAFVPEVPAQPRAARPGRAGSRHARRERVDPDMPRFDPRHEPAGFADPDLDPTGFAGSAQAPAGSAEPAHAAFADPYTPPAPDDPYTTAATAALYPPPAPADPGYGFGPGPGEPGVTDSGFGTSGFTQPGYGPSGFTEPGYGPSGFTEPEAGPPGRVNPRHGRHGRGGHAGPPEPDAAGFAPPEAGGQEFGLPEPPGQEFGFPAGPGLDGPASADPGPAGHAGQGRQRPPSRRGGNRSAGRRGRQPAGVPDQPPQAPDDPEFPNLESGAAFPSLEGSGEFPSLEALDRAAPVREAPARGPRRRPGRPAPARRLVDDDETASAAPDQETRRPRGRPSSRERTPREARRARRRVSNRALIAVAAAAVLGGAAFVLLTGHGNGAPHVVTVPNALGTYVKQPQLAVQMQAKQLQQEVIAQSAGEAKHVVYAVYEDSTGSAAKSAPQIILFIGGNLSGSSSGSFISSFNGKLQGAAVTSAGPMGGNAACVPSENGRLAECAWADNDTFGVVASPTMNSSRLAAEMRQIRPMVEHRSGSQP